MRGESRRSIGCNERSFPKGAALEPRLTDELALDRSLPAGNSHHRGPEGGAAEAVTTWVALYSWSECMGRGKKQAAG